MKEAGLTGSRVPPEKAMWFEASVVGLRLIAVRGFWSKVLGLGLGLNDRGQEFWMSRYLNRPFDLARSARRALPRLRLIMSPKLQTPGIFKRKLQDQICMHVPIDVLRTYMRMRILYIYIYTYIHTYIHACIHAYIYIYIYIYILHTYAHRGMFLYY